ncbi:MAG: hypothetical protein JNM49_09455 [Flavobacteriales bacterium]|jgi:hypothetical protein|nr:hypothetical protein [Flavobacteriales bacterium]
MWNDRDDIEVIEAYVEDRLNMADKAAFELRLDSDAALAELLSNYRHTRREIVEHHEDERVKRLLNAVEQRANGAGAAWWRWAAAAILLIGIGAATWWLLQPISLPALAEEFAVEETPLPVFMSASENPNVILDEAMQAYGMGDFATSLDRLAQLPASDTTLFFTGLAQMKLGHDPSTALGHVAEQQDSPFHSKAQYQLLIQALRNDNSALAHRLWSDQISDEAHPYHDRLDAIAARLEWKH